MTLRRTSAAISAGLLTLLATSGTALAQPSDGHTIYGVTSNGNRLVKFPANNPGAATPVTTSGNITGLGAGETVIGIDFRPVNGLLYAVTTSAIGDETSGTGRIYTIDKNTAAATLVPGSATLQLSGAYYDIDFNPVPNALRIVSSNGQNLRVTNVSGGDLNMNNVDTNLSYASGGPSTTPRVGGIAYTPATSGATTMYDVDYENDLVSTQGAVGGGTGAASPNSGVLNRVGATGVNVTNLFGFDIETDGTAYASAQTTGAEGGVSRGSTLYTVNLTNGALAPLGPVNGDLLDAIAVDTAAPGGGPNPVVPEFPLAALAPIAALGLGGLVVTVRRRRKQGATATA